MDSTIDFETCRAYLNDDSDPTYRALNSRSSESIHLRSRVPSLTSGKLIFAPTMRGLTATDGNSDNPFGFENCRVYLHGTNADTGEPIYDVRDYPDILDRSGAMRYGSIDHYFWGNYFVAESGRVLWADCYLKADQHLITGAYTVFTDAFYKCWYIVATGTIGVQSTTLPRNYWLGSKPAYGHNFTKVYPTFLMPSKVKKLLTPLLDCKTPASAVARLILTEIDGFPDDLTWRLENRRIEAGEYWGLL